MEPKRSLPSGISGFLDFIHRPVFEGTRRFGNWICFRPQVKRGGGEDTYSVAPPFLLAFPTKILHAFLFYRMRATFCAHLMLLNLIFLFIFGEEYKF
jgi:hypothetical protein